VRNTYTTGKYLQGLYQLERITAKRTGRHYINEIEGEGNFKGF